MPITPTVLTAGKSTVNTSSFVTSTYTPVANALITLTMMSGTTHLPVVAANGATWESVAMATRGIRTVRLFSAYSTAPVSGAATVLFTGATNETFPFNYAWCITQWTSAAVVVQATGANIAATALSIGLASFSNTSNVALGAFLANNRTPVTTGGGFISLAKSTIDDPTSTSDYSFITEYSVNSTAVSARTTVTTNAVNVMLGVAAELGPAAAPTQELSGSLSVPVTATGDVQTQHNLGGTASVVTTGTGTIKTAGQFLSGSISVPTTMTQNIGLEHKLQAAQLVASVVAQGDLRQVAEDVFTRTSVDFTFSGDINTRIGNRMRHRKLVNQSSPRFSKELTVTTQSTSIDLKPLANAMYSVLIPTATNSVPYRIASDTDAGVLLSGRSPSLISLTPGTTAMHLFTSVSSASIPMRVKVL